MPIRVFLISNFCLMLKGIEALLSQEPARFKLAGSASSYEQAAEMMAQLLPDLIVLDIDSAPDRVLPLVTTLRAISDAKILLLTRLEDSILQDKAVMFGARGVVDRNISPEQLLNAIEKVHEGQVWLDRNATGRIFVALSRESTSKEHDSVSAQVALLTEREQAIVSVIARNNGEPGKTIAKKLNISESTLRNHLTSIYEKLGVANRHGLLAYAFQNGLAERLGQ